MGCSAAGLDSSGLQIPSLPSTITQLFLPRKYLILGVLVYLADLGHFPEIPIFDSIKKELKGKGE